MTAAVPEGAQLSEDGSYWWDGSDWQPVPQGPDEGQLSEDGYYQWDGSDWQPVGFTLTDLGEFPTIAAWAEVTPSEDAAKDYFAQLGLDEAAASGEAIA
jgi:hypothetical protein